MSASDDFKCDFVREMFGARLRKGDRRNAIQSKWFRRRENILFFSKCGVTAALNRDEVRNAAHEIQILFLKRTHLRQHESLFTARVRKLFCHDRDSQSSQHALNAIRFRTK